jgi:hypothetical protein
MSRPGQSPRSGVGTRGARPWAVQLVHLPSPPHRRQRMYSPDAVSYSPAPRQTPHWRRPKHSVHTSFTVVNLLWVREKRPLLGHYDLPRWKRPLHDPKELVRRDYWAFRRQGRWR